MFDKLKQLNQLRKQAKTIQSELEKIHIEAEESGIKVTINAKQEVISVDIPEEMGTNTANLSRLLVKAFNKATKKSQEVAAEKMKGLMGDLGLPGM
jgi:DNA-binding protein YbaB